MKAQAAIISMLSENKAESTYVPLDKATFGVTDEADVAWMATRITAQPLPTFTEPVRLTDPAALALPRRYILCRQEEPSLFDAFARQAQAEGWGYDELRACHDAMITEPAALAQILLKIVAN